MTIKNIKKLRPLAIAAALILSGCTDNKPDSTTINSSEAITTAPNLSAGNTSTDENTPATDDKSQEESSSSLENATPEEVTDIYLGEIAVHAENIFGNHFSAIVQHTYDIDIYNRLKALRESSEMQPTLERKDVLFSVDVNNTLNSKYIYCTDGSWYYSDTSNHGSFMIPADNEKAALIADEIIAHTALDILAKDGKYGIGSSQEADTSEEKNEPQLDTDTSSIFGETAFFYVDDRSTKLFDFAKSGDDIYYLEETSTKTDVTIGGSPLSTDSDVYEYFGNSDEAYFRRDFYDIYYPADSFEGTFETVPLAKRIADKYTFAYGFNASLSTGDYLCEVYKGPDDNIAVLLDDDGKIVSGWQYGADGLAVMTALRSVDAMPIDINETLEHARTHTKEIADQIELDKKKTVDDWYKEDTAKYDLPDLLGEVVEGEAISKPSVVQKYLDYFKSNKPFTLEYRAIGGFRSDYNYLTYDGSDLYDNEIVSSHDNSFNYHIENIYTGDYIYISDDNGGFRRYDRSYDNEEFYTPEWTWEEMWNYLPDPLVPIDGLTYASTFKGTINGEEYDIEKWEFQNDPPVLFFCRDDELVAFRYNVFDRKTVFYITEFSETANSELIKAPGNASEISD
jgi:hypothetical protein